MDIEQQVVRAWNNVRQMLEDRGHEVAGAPGDLEVAALAGENGTFGVTAAEGVRVVFHVSQQSTKLKQEVFAAAGEARHAVLVLNTRTSGSAGASKPNNTTVKSLEQEARLKEMGLEIWTLKETQYNVTRHALVPRHVKLEPDEAEGVLEQLCVKNRYLLPAISHTDPVSRYLLLTPGDIVRIERPSPTAGQAVVYRCCRRG